MIEADRADHSRAKLDHDLIVPITRHERLAVMLLERSDVLTAIPDKQNQTTLSLVLSKGLHGIARILWERYNVNPDTADCSGHSSLPPPSRP